MLDTPARLAKDKRQADLEANRRAAMANMPHDQQQGVGPLGGVLGDGQVPQQPQPSASGSQNDTNGGVPSSQQPAGAAHQTQPLTGQVQQPRAHDQEAQRVADAEARDREILTGNQSIRNLVEATLTVNRIAVEDIYHDILAELVLSGKNGREVLNDMLAAAAAGKNPLPSQGDLNRALNAQDVPQISQRMIAQKKLVAEASKAKAEADAKMAEAIATLETAQKRAEEAKAEEARLQGELQAGIENGLAQLHNQKNDPNPNHMTG